MQSLGYSPHNYQINQEPLWFPIVSDNHTKWQMMALEGRLDIFRLKPLAQTVGGKRNLGHKNLGIFPCQVGSRYSLHNKKKGRENGSTLVNANACLHWCLPTGKCLEFYARQVLYVSHLLCAWGLIQITGGKVKVQQLQPIWCDIWIMQKSIEIFTPPHKYS